MTEETPYTAPKSDVAAPAGGAYEYNNLSFFNLQHLKFLYFSGEGRINRFRYFWGHVLWILPALVVSLTTYINNTLYILLMLVLSVLQGLASILMAIKRSHDLDKSGHFVWLFLIPIVNIWPTIVLLFFKGTEGENRFGADPLG